MSQQKSKKTLINWDLVSVNPNNKTWDWKDLFYFWGVNIQSIIGFSLIASLYIIYDMNSMVVFFGTVLGSFLVYLFSNWIGKPSQKHGPGSKHGSTENVSKLSAFEIPSVILEERCDFA